MYLALGILVASAVIIFGVFLYDHIRAPKTVKTHCYTFTHGETLVYVTSKTKLTDDMMEFHKKNVAMKLTGDESEHESILVAYLGVKPMGMFEN